jgi:hypothetical protein
VVLVRTDVSEERIASIIREIRAHEIGITLAVTSNRSTLHSISSQRADSCLPDDGGDTSSENSVRTRVTLFNIPEDGVLHVGLIFTFLEDPLWKCACVHGAARAELA